MWEVSCTVIVMTVNNVIKVKLAFATHEFLQKCLLTWVKFYREKNCKSLVSTRLGITAKIKMNQNDFSVSLKNACKLSAV